MHPFIIQSIAAERGRDLRRAAEDRRDARLGSDRGLRWRAGARMPGTVHLPLPARLRPHTS